MNRAARVILSTLIGLVLLLGAVGAVLLGLLAVTAIQQPLAHALAVAAELVAGTALLIAAVYLTMQIAVGLLARESRASRN